MCLLSAFSLRAQSPRAPSLWTRGSGSHSPWAAGLWRGERWGQGGVGLLWPPFTPRPGLGARLLDLGLFWPPCEELGPRAYVSRAPRPALEPAEAIRSHWQPVLASCCPWWRVRLLQGKSCPNRLSCRDRKKTTISLPGIPSAAGGREGGPSLFSSGGSSP